MHDVIVIGGGPAGAGAAARARQEGLDVVVLEKEHFPRFRIGESLLPGGNALLRDLGVWPQLEAAGFIRKHGAYFLSGDGHRGREIRFADGLVPGLDFTFQVERARFDQILLDHARTLGADVRLGARAVRVDEAPDQVTVVYAQEGKEHRVRARWLLDASGRERGLELPLKKELDPPVLARRIAIYTHLRGVARPNDHTAGHTIIIRLVDGWFWLIPIDEERTSVGLVTTVERMRSAGLPPAELFWREVAASPRASALVAGAAPAMAFHVTADYSYFHRRLARGRVWLCGDAAGFFDPIFSSGVFIAMEAGRDAITQIAGRREGAALDAWTAWRYTRRIKRQAQLFHRLIAAFYDNASVAVFLHDHAPWGIARAVNAIVAGHTQLTWPLWWRFQIFLAICRLQRHVRLVPPLAETPTQRPTVLEGEALEEDPSTAAV